MSTTTPKNNQITDEQISELAFRYYEEEGRPEGQADEHWARALRHLQETQGASEDGGPLAVA